MRRDPKALERARARRARDDEAPRLKEVVPDLDALSLTVRETPVPDSDKKPVEHVRRVVIEHAPARFELPCCDPRCDGGHDLTPTLMKALSRKMTAIAGRHRCQGTSKHGPCSFELAFTATASYR